MAAFLSGLKDQVMKMLPGIIEQNEPALESKLRELLRTIKTSNPEKAQLFLTNWRKLNTAIESELAAPAALSAGKRKRTRKLKHRKH